MTIKLLRNSVTHRSVFPNRGSISELGEWTQPFILSAANSREQSNGLALQSLFNTKHGPLWCANTKLQIQLLEREREKKEAKTAKYELVTCSSGCYVTSEFLGNWGGFESNVPGRRKLIGSEHSLPYLLLESVCRPAKAKSTQHTRSNSLLSANGQNPFERIPFVQEN